MSQNETPMPPHQAPKTKPRDLQLGTEQEMQTRLHDIVSQIRQQTDICPKLALVLGSGLGELAQKMEVCATVPYETLAGFPRSTVQGHRGQFLFGKLSGVPTVVMQGRVHYYEGYSMSQVVLPIRVMGMLGARFLLLTNAAGGMNPSFSPGDLMVITDHIATAVDNPLRGENLSFLGPRFPDMSEVYSARLRDVMFDVADRCKIPLRAGVYVQLSGPSYETPAEIRMYRMLGGDAVGMSTACEAIAARHMGLEVGGISCITNMAADVSDTPLSHEEVQTTATRLSGQFSELLLEIAATLKEL